MALRRLSFYMLTAVLLSGCSVFGGDDEEELQPAELLEFEETLDVQQLWTTRLGKKAEFLRLALRPAGDGSRIYAASHDGIVHALEPQTGKNLWRTETGVLLSAGPGIGEGLVVLGGMDGDLICLSADDGRELWRRDIDGEVLAAPVIKDDALVVYTIDGKLHVLSTFDGSERWSASQSLPPLTLRGAAAPVVVGNTVVAGFDNGRLLALDLDSGNTEWEAVLSPPTGRSDLERLSDVDGSIAVIGQDIYATGYQGRLASLAAESGQVLWAREISTHTGVSADWNNLYTTTGNGEIIALGRRNGTEAWRQDALLRREPSLPVPFATTVVTSDFEGYLHFFSTLDGRPVARRRVGKTLVSGAPVVINGVLYVQNEGGELAAFAMPERDTDAVKDGDN